MQNAKKNDQTAPEKSCQCDFKRRGIYAESTVFDFQTERDDLHQ